MWLPPVGLSGTQIPSCHQYVLLNVLWGCMTPGWGFENLVHSSLMQGREGMGPRGQVLVR